MHPQPSHKAMMLIIAGLAIGVAVGVGWYLKARIDDEELIQSVNPITTNPIRRIIGTSVEGRAIESYTYGTGPTRLLFVGGMHGGYEWNSTMLAYEFIDFLNDNPEFTAENVTVSVIPIANPDGLFAITGGEGRFNLSDVRTDVLQGTGRFNANGVDLNRNFDCKWQETSTWRGVEVSAGHEPFSEPEARAIRDFVAAEKPNAVVFWHSQANAVYASECEDGILPETLIIMNAYSTAAGYAAVASFDAYEITGDAEGWLASIGIPAITVELETHQTVEWERNLAGIKALMQYYMTLFRLTS
jgi:predicted deacylase